MRHATLLPDGSGRAPTRNSLVGNHGADESYNRLVISWRRLSSKPGRYRRDTSAGVGTSRSQEVVVLALVGGLTQQFQVVSTEEFAVVLGAKRD